MGSTAFDASALSAPFSGASSGASFRGASFTSRRVPPASRVRLRLTRRGHAVLTVLAALPVVIGAIVFALNGGGAVATDAEHAATFQHVTVQTGESLWVIAERIAPTADPRDVIADLVTLNGLETAVVAPGQQLAVPPRYAR